MQGVAVLTLFHHASHCPSNEMKCLREHWLHTEESRWSDSQYVVKYAAIK